MDNDDVCECKVNDYRLRSKQVATMNRRISIVPYFESRPLTSCPHFRRVSNIS